MADKAQIPHLTLVRLPACPLFARRQIEQMHPPGLRSVRKLRPGRVDVEARPFRISSDRNLGHKSFDFAIPDEELVLLGADEEREKAMKEAMAELAQESQTSETKSGEDTQLSQPSESKGRDADKSKQTRW